ncbi:hypothetical protein [Jeotgalibacillus marinus]|uniref:ATP synthase F(0) sector subunit c n=1 Tax=Jeotgalibacillus marinus TaxID=86667 RepID=A0ABV3Q3Z9_9BACL
MSTLKKISCGLCCISAGLAMLAYIGLGLGLGTMTAAAVEAIGRNPEAAMSVIIALIIGVIAILILGVLAFIVAKKLICVAKRSCDSDC